MLSFCGICYAAPVSDKAVEPNNTVLRLYKDFAWEVLLDTSELKVQGLIDQPRPVLTRYFDNKLVELLLADRACAEKNGVCKLDYLPWWGGQDPGASDLQILATEDPSIINVHFKYPGNSQLIRLKFVMTQTKAGWRISDIIDGAGNSMLRTLTQ